MAREKRFSKKEWSWIMYDWANSVYATNIMAAIYPTIFASTIPGGDIRWGYGTSIATFIVAILAPFLGAVADYKGMKKKLFTLFALLGIVFTPLMAALGSWKLCLVGYVVSRIGFSGSCLFYDSFLTDVTTDERMDHVSSWGYAMGYIGGSTIPFVLSIAMLLFFDYNRFSQVFSVLIVSAWWALFSIPFFRNVKQEHYVEKTEPVSPARIFRNVIGAFKEICLRRGLLFFVIAYFFYIDGVNTVISISTAYGSTLGLGSTGMILALLVTQIVAVPCSIWFAKLSARFSTRKALMGAVIMYVIICLVGFYMGFSMEPSQKAYETAIHAAAQPYEAANPDKAEALESYVTRAGAALLRENPETELKQLESECAALELDGVALSDALLNAWRENTALAEEYNACIHVSTILFWCMAVLVGTVQGGIQAVSRSYFGKLVPKERSNEFFGFFDIFGKCACVIGPALYAVIAEASGRSSYGIIGIAMLFFLGLVTLILGRKDLDALAK